MTEAEETTEIEGLSRTEIEGLSEFDKLVALILELPPERYASPWSDGELVAMRKVLKGGLGRFPKKVRPYIEIFRKFMFANGQLISMAALAHQTAAAKRYEEESIVKPATFSDLGKLEANKGR